jgi:tellurite resistance protein
MSREQGLNRKERNSALIEVMLLAAVADGTVSDAELQMLLKRIIERPEFEGTRPEEINRLVQSCLKSLASAKSI